MARALLVDVVVTDCGCNLQIWVEDDVLHVGACCPACRQLAREAIENNFGRLPVQHVE